MDKFDFSRRKHSGLVFCLRNWKEIIEDELALDTIVDKLEHGSLHLHLQGETYRKKKSQKQNIDNDRVPQEIAEN